jgi:hypothetical protein
MVPGWSERERQGFNAMRHEWMHVHRRDGPIPGIRAALRRVRKFRKSLAVSGMKVMCWLGQHMVQLASLPSQIWALRTFSLLEQLSRGGTQ